MVKIKIVSGQYQTFREYVKKVAESIDHLRDFETQQPINQAIYESAYEQECHHEYGSGWTYDRDLKACVNSRESMWNSRLTREQDALVVKTDPALMGYQTPPESATDTNVYTEPFAGTNMGPSGTRFRGNMRNVSQQTNVAMGSDPAATKPEGVWQTAIAEAVYNEEGKLIRIKLR